MNRHFPPSFFAGNRQRAIERLRGAAIALTGYVQLQRINDIGQSFEQESNFWYLTGINEPGWQVIIDGKRGKAWLVQPTISREQELFGGCLTAEEAVAISGIDDIIDQTASLSILRQMARTHSLVYTCDQPPTHGLVPNPAPREFRQLLERHFNSVQDCRQELATIRSIKQPLELEAIKRAVKITLEGFEKVRRQLQNYRHEFEVEADFSHTFRRQGCHHAYLPIIAGGSRACTLHYEKNNQPLKKRQLLLMDVGASYGHYAADITRTYVTGDPTKRQRDIHDATREAQKEIIQLCQPGMPLSDYRERADAIMERALVDLKLMEPGDRDAFYTYFPHAVGHGLGLDVHDSMGAQAYFQVGMVITVEPGIYSRQEGIGVRIEDDIYISEDGPVNLSAKLSTSIG
ncbi:MAG TPA: Xaa-Pro aminopeptidase [Verrucomicrobiae bacterium]|nr:Xaa-Pro aminopeptidase [Verrucomicrobiae bacterium]